MVSGGKVGPSEGTVGPAERRARVVIDRYAATLRGLAGLSAGALGLLTEPVTVAQRPLCAAVLVWAVTRTVARRSRSPFWTGIDLTVAIVSGLTAPLTVSPAQAAAQQGFVANVANPANLTFAWFYRRGWALALSATVIAAVLTGAALTTGQPFWTLSAFFTMPLQALLSWALVGVFLPAARAADRAAARRTEALMDHDLAVSRRAAAWEHWTLLHDTAASTLVMVADGVLASAGDRIRRQARRDLRALERPGTAGAAGTSDPIDLVEVIARGVAESGVRVDLEVTGHPAVPPDVTAAMDRAVRELLLNVQRHARVDEATVQVRAAADSGVVIGVRDRGIGFDPSGPATRLGLRESVVGRLRRVGATAHVVSAPGAGATVTLSWTPPHLAAPPTPRTGDPAAPPARAAVPYLRNYGVGLAAITAAVVVQFAAVAVLTDAAPLVPTLLATLVALAATAAAAGRMARGRGWDRATTVAWLLVALTMSTAYTFVLEPGAIARPANWVLGAVPYVLVVLLTGHRLRWSLLAVAVPVAVDTTLLLTSGGLSDLAAVVRFGQQVVGLTLFPLAAAAFHPRLSEVARLAAADDDARAVIETQERRTAALAADRADRALVVSTTVVPLLQALADGSADPQDDRVRRSARIESARLRRMFAENDDVDDPVVHEVRASVEACERTGVAATLDVHGTSPPLPVEIRRPLLEAPMALLARAVDSARVVVDATDRQVAVSVVTRVPGFVGAGSETSDGPVTVRSVVSGEQVWVQSTWKETQ